MMPNGNVIKRTYCTMKFFQRLPIPKTRNLSNGFRLMYSAGEWELIPMGMISIEPTEKGWDLIHNWSETNTKQTDNDDSTLSLDDALRKP